MRTVKHVLTFLAALLFFCCSLVVLRRVLGVTTPWLALLAMFYFLALAKVAEPLFVLRMPAVLRPLRSWERQRNAYRRLAVPGFGTILRRTPLRYLNSAVYLDKRGRDLRQVRHQAESAEASHFWAAVLLLPYIVFAWFNGQRLAAVGLLLAQVLVNCYPVLHLRFVRARLDRVVHRHRAVEGASTGP